MALRPRLHAAASSALAALRAGSSTDEALRLARDDLRDACAVARRRGVPAEHVISMLKESCRAAPDSHRVRWVDADLVRARLMTLCVLSYYVGDPA